MSTVVPPACRERLVAHYGRSVEEWLATVTATIVAAAEAWNLRVGAFHDVGHASVLVTATDTADAPLILKAWPDPGRFRLETAALRLWHAEPETAVVRVTDDDSAVAALAMVGGRPGGSARPADDQRLVADALHRVHRIGSTAACHRVGSTAAWSADFPLMDDYVTKQVLPRVHHRSRASAHRELAEHSLSLLVDLHEDPHRHTVLHGDLYSENVPFDQHGRPILLDPVPMRGDAVFDWAFWIVYYRVGRQVNQRIREALRVSGVPLSELLPWCVLLAVDGLLYYEETSDARLTTMTSVLRSLLAHPRRAAS